MAQTHIAPILYLGDDLTVQVLTGPETTIESDRMNPVLAVFGPDKLAACLVIDVNPSSDPRAAMAAADELLAGAARFKAAVYDHFSNPARS